MPLHRILSYPVRAQQIRHLGQYQRKILVLNPKQVRKFKDSYPDLPKNDWVDALVTSDHLRYGAGLRLLCLFPAYIAPFAQFPLKFLYIIYLTSYH